MHCPVFSVGCSERPVPRAESLWSLKHLRPRARRYNWLQGGIKDFFVRPSCHECAKVWDYVKQFKENNRKINEVTESARA